MFNASAKAVKTIVRPAQRSKAVLSSGFGNAARYFGVLRFYFYAYFFRQKAVRKNTDAEQKGSTKRFSWTEGRFFDYQT